MRDDGFFRCVMRVDAHFAGQDKDNALRGMSCSENQFAGGVALKIAEPPQAIDLDRAQSRKHLIAARLRDRSQILGHIDPFSAVRDKTR